MEVTNQDPTLIILLGSIGILLFGAVAYGIYITVGPKSKQLRDTIQEHARMHDLGIAHTHKENSYSIAEKLSKSSK
tara:strand:+ start:9880 stop:10107 length:228 start_codon:yes stop_codon:yes gene_type:complete